MIDDLDRKGHRRRPESDSALHQVPAVLDEISTIYRESGTMALWGIAGAMAPGQSPRDLVVDGHVPKEWAWLGSPGWWGSMSARDRGRISEWLDLIHQWVPVNPGEWCQIPPKAAALLREHAELVEEADDILCGNTEISVPWSAKSDSNVTRLEGVVAEIKGVEKRMGQLGVQYKPCPVNPRSKEVVATLLGYVEAECEFLVDDEKGRALYEAEGACGPTVSWDELPADERADRLNGMIAGLLQYVAVHERGASTVQEQLDMWSESAPAPPCRDGSVTEAMARGCYEAMRPGECWESLPWEDRDRMVRAVEDALS